jgi:hypothetical protein
MMSLKSSAGPSLAGKACQGANAQVRNGLMPLDSARLCAYGQLLSAQWALHRQKWPKRTLLWCMIELSLTYTTRRVHTGVPMRAV